MEASTARAEEIAGSVAAWLASYSPRSRTSSSGAGTIGRKASAFRRRVSARRWIGLRPTAAENARDRQHSSPYPARQAEQPRKIPRRRYHLSPQRQPQPLAL